MKNTLRILILSFVFICGFKARAFNVDTLYVCRGNGIYYSNTTTQGKAIAWYWTFEEGSDASGQPYLSSADSAPAAPVRYNKVGIFLTTIKTTFSTGADSFDQVHVKVIDWPMPNFYFPKDTGYCPGSNFQLRLSTTSYPNLKYLWSTGETTQSIIVNSPGTYTVTLRVVAGTNVCETVQKQVNVVEYPAPTVYLGQDKTMCQNQSIILNAGSGAGYKYLWAPNGEVTQTLNVSFPGVYKVTVTNKEGCIAEDEIEFVDSCPHYVFVPNAVSPNEDLLNDFFIKVWNFTPKDYTFSIYNRWGELLFETTDVTAGWNCKVNDTPVQQDIYVYKITYFDSDKKWYEMRGTFFVVR